MTVKVDLAERKWFLDDLAEPIEAGERIEIRRGNRLVAEILPVAPASSEHDDPAQA